MRLPLGIVVSLLLVKFIQAQLPGRPYVIEHMWSTLDFALPNGQSPSLYVRDVFDRRNLIVEDAVKTRDRRTIVSTKVYDGLPTLSILINGPDQNRAILIPYPHLDFHVTINTCRRIMEVRALLIDDYHRLWILSKGLGACPDRLLVFSLSANQLIAHRALPNGLLNRRRKEGEIYNGASIEAPRESPNNVAIYCYNYDGMLRLRIELRRRRDGTIDIGYTFGYMNRLNIPPGTLIQNGLTAMSLSPYTYPSSSTSSANPIYPERYLYFGILPKNNLYRVTIRLVVDGPIESVRYYKATQQAISRDGIVFYSLNGYDGVDCYNFRNGPHTPFNGILFREFVGGFYSALRTYQVQVNNIEEERLMAFHKRNLGDPNPEKRVYTIVTGRVKDIVRATSCSIAFNAISK